MSINSIRGSQYFVTFICDYSRYTHVHFIKYKHEVLVKFKLFNFATNLTGKQVKFCILAMVANIVQSDLIHTWKKKGFSTKQQFLQPTSKWCSWKNELYNCGNSLINDVPSQMPIEFWAEAINTAVYLWNHSSTTLLIQLRAWYFKPGSIWMFDIHSHSRESAQETWKVM